MKPVIFHQMFGQKWRVVFIDCIGITHMPSFDTWRDARDFVGNAYHRGIVRREKKPISK